MLGSYPGYMFSALRVLCSLLVLVSVLISVLLYAFFAAFCAALCCVVPASLVEFGQLQKFFQLFAPHLRVEILLCRQHRNLWIWTILSYYYYY